MFSVVIPSWNNLPFLQLCIRSLRDNSARPHQIIVHVNEGSDGTLEWVKGAALDYTHSKENIGICYAMNEAAAKSTQPYIYYLNDDMYCCPGWDTALEKRIETFADDPFVLSSRAVEPRERLSPCAMQGNFGTNLKTFSERELLGNFQKFYGPDFYSGGSVPTLVSRSWWTKVGGYSVEFSPGMNSDNDFVMKMWNSGCRIFIGAGDSIVYHFRSQTTDRLEMNRGSRQFLDKWKVSSRVFSRYYLRQGEAAREPRLPPSPTPSLRLQVEYLRSFIKRRFL